MDVKYIIADSGGSSTTWAIVPDKGEVVFIQTESLHPKYALSASFSLSGLKSKFREMNAPLYFYGAGCSGEVIQKQMEALLLQVGFPEVHVYPDTLAACRALHGNRPGWVAILGTGSILVHYDGMHITKRIGGYGSLIGDEGSGFYFGKLVVQELLRTEEWEAEWTKLFQSRAHIFSKLADPDAQKWISGLGAETAKMDFGFLHERNAELFVELYCLPVSGLNEISFIGTYGFEQAPVFTRVFEAHSIRVKKGIASPVKDLVDYHRMNEG
jgi:N-acetylglucosamine kinase-like BadF-type ATPase